MELADRVDQRVLIWSGQMERMDEYRVAFIMVLMAEVSRVQVRCRPGLGWMNDVKVTYGS